MQRPGNNAQRFVTVTWKNNADRDTPHKGVARERPHVGMSMDFSNHLPGEQRCRQTTITPLPHRPARKSK